MLKNPITIQVYENPNHKDYQDLYEMKVPFFHVGETIQGFFKISLSTSENVKHRGVFVSIVSNISDSKRIDEETELISKRILDSGQLYGSFSSQFVFDSPQINHTTFFGKTFKLSLHVKVSISRFLRHDISHYHPIVIINPSITYTPRPPVSMSVVNPYVYCSVLLKRTHFSSEESILGNLQIGDVKKPAIDILYLCLRINETFKAMSQSKAYFKYQLLDGTPRPNTSIPFSINIKPYMLWPNYESSKFPIKIEYSLEVHMIMLDGTKYMTNQPIDIH